MAGDNLAARWIVDVSVRFELERRLTATMQQATAATANNGPSRPGDPAKINARQVRIDKRPIRSGRLLRDVVLGAISRFGSVDSRPSSGGGVKPKNAEEVWLPEPGPTSNLPRTGGLPGTGAAEQRSTYSMIANSDGGMNRPVKVAGSVV